MRKIAAYSKRAMLVIFLLATSCPAVSKQNQSESDNESLSKTSATPQNGNSITTQNSQVLEEVIVTGQATPHLLKRETLKVQQLVYKMFNDLNTDKDYDMVCQKRARIGSQIRYKVCKPRIAWTAESERWSDWIDEDVVDLAMPTRTRIEDRKYMQRQREIMAEIANTNPEFLELLKRRLALRKAYEAETGERATLIND